MELRAGSLSLTGTDPTEGAGDLVIVATSEEQVTKAINAPGIDLQDRGNYQHTLTWSVQRQHVSGGGNADPEAAAFFLVSHLAQVEGLGKTVLTYKTDAGTYYFTPALVRITKASSEGCRTFHVYRVVAGIITSKEPAGASGGGPSSWVANGPVSDTLW